MGDALSQKTNARRVLAILVGLLASLLALQGLASIGSGGLTAFAQDASPTPTNRTIQILNPDRSTSEVISNKNDGVDTSYHLVAWVNTPTSGDVVQFQYVPEGGREISIICGETGTNRAAFVAPDTYECHWDLTNVPEGSETGIVRAQLFSNSTTPVATDEEPAEIDRSAETVEILYPTNGGEVGFYTQPGGTSTAMIDVSTSGATTEGGQATEFVRVYYSVSPPGTEPSFFLCGDEETAGGTRDSVRCTLTQDDPGTAANEGHSPEQVTAIAAAAGFIDEGVLDPLNQDVLGSADAHRAFGYEQNPTTVTITPSTQNATRGTCSAQIIATVTDSRGRQVVGVNVDVHAQGPTDNLSFDDSDTNDENSNHKVPENHSSEPAINCESTDSPKPLGGQQGDHDQIGPDVKHIESLETAGAGTDDNGRFTFQLHSPDAGTTQFTAWADEDGNDRFCGEEAHGDGSIGWDTTAPSPTGVTDEDTSCPTPTSTGSPTGNPTGSPTSSPTATASPTSTQTGPQGSSRSVSVTTNKQKMPAGRKVTFSGRIVSNDTSCTDDEFVQIRRRIHGTEQYKDLFGTQTDNNGSFSVERRARKGADYIAVAPAREGCQEAVSDPATVLIKVLIQILPSDKNPDRGEWIRIKSSVRPQHDRTRLILQRKKGDGWAKVASTKMNNRSIGNFWMRARWNSRTFRTRWRKQHEDHIANRSRAVTIRTN